MTNEERQQSLINARRGAWKIAEYAAHAMQPDDPLRIDIECLFAEVKRLDDKQQKQIKGGAKGGPHGSKGGRPKGSKKGRK